jgi:YbbR domain-containing protein
LLLKKWRKNKLSDLTKKSITIQKYFHKASSNRKLYVFLFCLSLSIFFWLLNALSKNFTTNAVFNVTYINQPINKVVLNELPNQLTIKIKGLGFDLMAYKLRLKSSSVKVDLSKLKGFNGHFQSSTLASTSFYSNLSTQLGEQIEIKSIYPDSIQFIFDERKEKIVKIIANTELSFQKQFQLYGNLIVKPAITKVSGPASIIDTIASVYTNNLVLNELSENTTVSVGFSELYQDEKLIFNPNKVIIHVPVEKFTEKSVLVDVKSINVPDSIEIKAIP